MAYFQRPQRKGLSFSTAILLGVVMGTIWGVLFGDYGSWVKWIGDAFVGLLQMTVLPYVTLSMVSNVGRLSSSQGRMLARVAGLLLVFLWGIGLLTLVAMSFSFPKLKTGSFFSSSVIEEPVQMDWLELFIPSNPFWSLTNNLVPAVVLFSLGLGTALISVPNKDALLDKLDVLIEALARLNKFVVRLSPLGIFGIVGHTAGTMSLEQFGLIQGYLLVYGVAAILLSLWVMPMLIACCTPFSYRDSLSSSRDMLMAAFVIGNTFVVLPMIIEAVKKMMQQHGLEREDTQHVPEYFTPLAYPFPDLGRIVGLIFIPFAAWFYGDAIDPSKLPQLLGVGFTGAFAKPVVTMPLLLTIAELPSDIFNLYIVSGVVASRFGDLMKASHLFAFSLLTACTLAGAMRFDTRRFAFLGAISLVLFVGSIVSIRTLLAYSFEGLYSKEQLIAARKLQSEPVDSALLQASEPNPIPLSASLKRMDRILQEKVIRIGVDVEKLPFSYVNQDGVLIGLDIDMAHQLARDLDVRIEFVPFDNEALLESLQADHFDIAMSGLEGTIERATKLPAIQPYLEITTAFVVPDHLRRHFQSLDRVRKLKGLKIAVVTGSAASEFPIREDADFEVVRLESERAFFTTQPALADVLVTSAEAGSAWTLMYPEFSVVKPAEFDVQVPLYYLVGNESQFEEFMENWLTLKRRDGTIQTLYEYWILGQDHHGEMPRWCVVRDVLHWVK